jgi:L-alanine-DL-glutamate epimerase-like enolase superfamily enzyme
MNDHDPGDRISSVESIALELPLQRPVAFSTRRLTARSFCLVKIRTEDGAEGVGYSYGGELIAHAVDLCLAPLLLGRQAAAIEETWSALYRDAILLGRRGAVLRALSAVDIALWDLAGKRAGLPLSRMLGGGATSVPAYFSGGYYRDEGRVQDVADEAQRALDAGFSWMKIKVGRSLKDDLVRTRLAREVLGDDALLALDANNAWDSAAEALPACRRFAEHDVWWIEEPLYPDDVAGHAALARDLETPIATGEIEGTRWGFAALVEARAADILQPDACVLGGVSEWLKVAHLAAAHGLPVAPHWNADVHVHLAAAVGNCLAIEWFDLAEDVYNFDLVLGEHLAVRDGQVEVPQRPGVGLVLDDEAVARFTSWSSSRPGTAGGRGRPARSLCAATPPPGSGTR